MEAHGEETAVPCPTCDVGRLKEFRLWWNDKKGVGTCYKCEETYDAVKLIRALTGCSYADALRTVKEHTVSSALSLPRLQARIATALAPPAEVEEELPSMAPPLEMLDCVDYAPKDWPPYIMERIGSVKTIRDLGVGWCDRGYFAQRMIVPVMLHGRMVSFIARDMTGKAEKKVLYPKGAKTSRCLFNYDRAKHFGEVVLTEGVLDAIRVGPRAMAVFGTHLSDAQVRLLQASKATRVVILFDGDEAGRAGTMKALARLKNKLHAYDVVLPNGTDPDDFPRDVLAARIASVVSLGRPSTITRVRSALRGR